MKISDFSNLVKLYRKAGEPSLKDGVFSADIAFTPENRELISSIQSNTRNKRCGFFQVVELDDIEVENGEFPSIGKKISFEWKVSTSGSCNFYKNIGELIEKQSVGKGVLPELYFLIDERYSSIDEAEKPNRVSKLASICNAISYLSKLAQHHDEKIRNNYYRLVFIHTVGDQNIVTTVLDTKVDGKIVDFDELDVSILKEITEGVESHTLHVGEKKGILRTTLSEFIHESPRDIDSFNYLVQHWGEFLNRFQLNLDAYLSRFSFSAIRREVAEAEFKIAEQYSKVMGDITGKLLSLPVSLVAIIGLAATDDGLVSSIYVFGCLIVAIVMVGSVINQQNQLYCINESKNLVFDTLNGKKDTWNGNPISYLDYVQFHVSDLSVFSQTLPVINNH